MKQILERKKTHTQILLSGFHSNWCEELHLLGYKALWFVENKITVWRNMSPPLSGSKNNKTRNNHEVSRTILPKGRFTFSRLHSVTSQKTDLSHLSIYIYIYIYMLQYIYNRLWLELTGYRLCPAITSSYHSNMQHGNEVLTWQTFLGYGNTRDTKKLSVLLSRTALRFYGS
jgi:hypothetical protein